MDKRYKELAERLVSVGKPLQKFSASELHELHDFIMGDQKTPHNEEGEPGTLLPPLPPPPPPDKLIREGDLYIGYQEDVINTLMRQVAIPKKLLRMAKRYDDIFKGKRRGLSADAFIDLEKEAGKHGLKAQDALDAVLAQELLNENERRVNLSKSKFKDIGKFIKHYIRGNLRVDVEENHRGFNGISLDIKLVLEDETISEGSHTLKEDDG